jgi:8-oxo-dGTP pyrophosphatase MutT (NUDIX family)
MSSLASRPVVPRPAATVMVVRPARGGHEVFMVRRHQASKFAADVFVFPGGTVRPDDQLAPEQARALGLDAAALHAVLAARQDPFAADADGGLSLWVAALRELFEEAGLLLADEATGRPLDLAEPGRAASFASYRNALQKGELSLLELAERESLRLRADRLVYFSRWITPPSSPRRYDTRFLVAELPVGQIAGHCQIETTDGLWVQPNAALESQAEEAFPMMFVTREHVKRLADFREPADLLEFARHKPIRVVRGSNDPARGRSRPAEQQPTW